MATFAMLTCSLPIPMNVTRTVKTVTTPGPQMTLSRTILQTRHVAVFLSRERLRATPLARGSARAIRVVRAPAAVTADGAGHQMTQPSGCQLSRCAGASQKKLRSTSGTTARTPTMASAGPTARAATGLGLRLTLRNGGQMKPTADAQLPTSKRLSLAAIVVL